MEWSRLLLNAVVCNEHVTVHHAAEWAILSLLGGGLWECTAHFLSLVTWPLTLTLVLIGGTKHVFRVNSMQIRLSVSEIFDSETKKTNKKSQTVLKQNMFQ